MAFVLDNAQPRFVIDEPTRFVLDEVATSPDTLAPDFMGEAVGEPKVLGKAIDVPFIPGREISRSPGAFTEADPFAIDEKGMSISDMGGKLGRVLLSQGAATEA